MSAPYDSVLRLACGHTTRGAHTSEVKKCKKCRTMQRVVGIAEALPPDQTESAKMARRVERYEDPHYVSDREQAVLDAIAADMDLEDIAAEVVVWVHSRAARHAELDKIIRELEARKMLAVRWIDGDPQWTVAPLGPWTLSRKAVSKRSVRMRRQQGSR